MPTPRILFVDHTATLGGGEIALLNLVPWQPMRTPMKLAAIAWMFAYVPMALRRLYGGRWLPTLARTSVLAASYGALLVAAVAVIGVGLVFMY